MDNDDLKFMRMAIDEAQKCKGEDGRVHPKVGAVVVLNGEVLETAYRGELADGDHAEFTVLDKKLAATKAAGATVYTTLEPCTVRTPEKTPCADRLIARRVGRVVIGMLDPNPDICGKGFWLLREHGIATDVFPHELMAELEDLNRDFIRHHRPKRPHAVAALSTVAPSDAAEETTKQATPTATTEVSAENDLNDTFVAFHKALRDGDLAQGDALYQKLSQSLKENGTQPHLDAMYYDLRYRASADPNDLAHLETLLQDDLAGYDAASRRGAISLLANDLTGACGYYAKAAELAKIPEDRICAVVSQANTLMKIESQGDALRLLLSHLKPDLPPAATTNLLNALSQTFGKYDMPYMSVALLAKAAQLIPADGNTRFRAALKLSELGITHLSLLLYERLSRLNKEDKGVLNNLGIQCLKLEMPMKGIEYYRKAAEAGLTLGKTNLAFEYLKAGFLADAKRILEDAQKDLNALPQTGHVMIAMGDKIKQEGEIWEEARALANKEQLFLSNCADSLMLTGAQATFYGQWEIPDGGIVGLEDHGDVFTGEWGDEDQRKRVTITTFGAAGVLSYENLGMFVYGADRRKDGLVYLANEGAALRFFYMVDEKPVFEMWKRKIEPLLLTSANQADDPRHGAEVR